MESLQAELDRRYMTITKKYQMNIDVGTAAVSVVLYSDNAVVAQDNITQTRQLSTLLLNTMDKIMSIGNANILDVSVSMQSSLPQESLSSRIVRTTVAIWVSKLNQ